MKYTFGKGMVGLRAEVRKAKATLDIYKVTGEQTIGGPINGKLKDPITIEFSTIKSLDRMINELQEMKKELTKQKVQKLLARI